MTNTETFLIKFKHAICYIIVMEVHNKYENRTITILKIDTFVPPCHHIFGVFFVRLKSTYEACNSIQ